MVVRKVTRRKDCKYYVERGLEKLGYSVNDRLQEKLAQNECTVTYTGCREAIDTTESYYGPFEMCITFQVDDNNEIPYMIMEIMPSITKYVEDSGAPWCTSFRFSKTEVRQLGGTTSIVNMYCIYDMELDWVD